MRIDLNADVGEGVLCEGRPVEELLLPLVTSANVCCGVHAGDEGTMRAAVEAAARAGVAIGAHPGLADREPGGGVGGRSDREILDVEAFNVVLSQASVLMTFLRKRGLVMSHVKPHGVLYNRAARDRRVAAGVAGAIAALRLPAVAEGGEPVQGADVAAVAFAGSLLAEYARSTGARVIGEAFPDRGYRADGTLVPRGEPGALVEDPADAAARAVSIATREEIRAATGEVVRVRAETLCIHGDSPRAVETARAVRAALEAAGVEIRRF
ncbi:MAG: LamB/YcsF family protein [Planctomycetales bacterium]|nr:LamB/YcsF family protein [Planctomycetales bacterium]